MHVNYTAGWAFHQSHANPLWEVSKAISAALTLQKGSPEVSGATAVRVHLQKIVLPGI